MVLFDNNNFKINKKLLIVDSFIVYDYTPKILTSNYIPSYLNLYINSSSYFSLSLFEISVKLVDINNNEYDFHLERKLGSIFSFSLDNLPLNNTPINSMFSLYLNSPSNLRKNKLVNIFPFSLIGNIFYTSELEIIDYSPSHLNINQVYRINIRFKDLSFIQIY